MNIKPLSDSDFQRVEILNGTPHCKKHGAMNKITPDGIWRCITVSGYRVVKNDQGGLGKLHQETICRAGCEEIGSRQ